MKRALHVGDATHLNIYTVGPNFQLLGFATFPVDFQHSPKLDGVVVLNGSLPGGDADFGPGAVYNEGDTVTHEVGHWLNLYHTFQGGCGPLNDLVTDTPRQLDGPNVFKCNQALDTCKKDLGRDPVHNFMNYTDDPCMDLFTGASASGCPRGGTSGSPCRKPARLTPATTAPPRQRWGPLRTASLRDDEGEAHRVRQIE